MTRARRACADFPFLGRVPWQRVWVCGPLLGPVGGDLWGQVAADLVRESSEGLRLACSW